MIGHPMIQPVNWKATPESLEGSVPEVRRKLYKIIWDCALACTLVPPVLRHSRSVYRCGKLLLAVVETRVAGPIIGYRRFRQDVPQVLFPRSQKLPSRCNLKVVAATPVWKSHLTVDRLILEMESTGIGTPSSTAKLLQDLLDIDNSNPAGVTEADLTLKQKDQISSGVEVTDLGKRRLRSWQDVGLVGVAERTHRMVNGLASGSVNIVDAFTELLPKNDDRKETMISYVQSAVERWNGLERLDGFASIRRRSSVAPIHGGLPRWLDPELKLPKDHPLRLVKGRMEADLAARRPEWGALGNETKAAARVEWINAHKEELGEFLWLVEHSYGSTSIFFFWLTGSKARFGEEIPTSGPR